MIKITDLHFGERRPMLVTDVCADFGIDSSC